MEKWIGKWVQIWIQRRMERNLDVDCGCQREDVEEVNVVVFPFGPPVSQAQKLQGKECTVRRQVRFSGEVTHLCYAERIGCAGKQRRCHQLQKCRRSSAGTLRDLRRHCQARGHLVTSNLDCHPGKSSFLQAGAVCSTGAEPGNLEALAAEMRTVDWRGRRCHRRHPVWLCQSPSLHSRGRQAHRQEERRGPSDAGSCR